MTYDTYLHLLNIIEPKIKKRKRGPNGSIEPSVMLSVAIRFFAGGSPYDIAVSHGIARSEVYKSVWTIVDLVNTLPEFSPLRYPNCHEEQKNCF